VAIGFPQKIISGAILAGRRDPARPGRGLGVVWGVVWGNGDSAISQVCVQCFGTSNRSDYIGHLRVAPNALGEKPLSQTEPGPPKQRACPTRCRQSC